MISGIGTDLVFMPRIQQLLDKFGDKAAQKILSEPEFIDFQKASRPAAFLAKRCQSIWLWIPGRTQFETY